MRSGGLLVDLGLGVGVPRAQLGSVEPHGDFLGSRLHRVRAVDDVATHIDAVCHPVARQSRRAVIGDVIHTHANTHTR